MNKSNAFVIALATLFLTSSALGAVSESAPPRTLTVTGNGVVKSAPDAASFSSGVVSLGTTAKEALAANSRAMNSVMAALKRQGVPDKAIQTSNLSLSPRYQQCKPGTDCPQKITGYQASNTVSVTVALAKAGEVLDALVSSGSNEVGGISFSITDPEPLLKEARAAAMKDAIARAETYAKAAGVNLGAIQSIQEGGSDVPRPMFKAMLNRVSDIGAFPTSGGEESISANVSVTWEIK